MGMDVQLEGFLNVETGEGFSYRFLQIRTEGAVKTGVVVWMSVQAKRVL